MPCQAVEGCFLHETNAQRVTDEDALSLISVLFSTFAKLVCRSSSPPPGGMFVTELNLTCRGAYLRGLRQPTKRQREA